MSWLNRFRLFFGIVFVAALVGVLLLYLNYSMAHIGSRTAQLQAQDYTIGTDYSGIISKQNVVEGQHVSAGQALFTIDATTNTSSADGTTTPIVLKATNAGVVTSIAYVEGSFVPANKEVATVTKDDSLYVAAKYELAPPDYARLKLGDIVHVTLPNNQQVSAVVFDIAVENNDNSVQTVIKAKIQGLDSTTFTAGTPVSTELRLSGKTFYDSLKESLQKLFKPRG